MAAQRVIRLPHEMQPVVSAFTSLDEIGRSLRDARDVAGLTVTQAATGAGIDSFEVEALESGAIGMRDRVETVRAVRSYAGDDWALPVIYPGEEEVLDEVHVHHYQLFD